ncbi:DUF6126 family protein [Kitasatospora viridis]|uniref:Uncharacterized protein n=1 Tax=Kitasatospora viridis TaxID=281105 RepID=A0A561UQ00_9ACTN|nr:DUF6126 family protein [Kitasatospora viridis]TWG01442.1 hypothetical protein FHX73_115335 [Kitasatospora viridis]
MTAAKDAAEDAVQPVGTPAQSPAVPPVLSPVDGTVRDEKSKRKAALTRAAIYIAGTHFFAFFVMLLFYLGSHRH